MLNLTNSDRNFLSLASIVHATHTAVFVIHLSISANFFLYLNFLFDRKSIFLSAEAILLESQYGAVFFRRWPPLSNLSSRFEGAREGGRKRGYLGLLKDYELVDFIATG